jgi:mannose-6-phosphate isomerase
MKLTIGFSPVFRRINTVDLVSVPCFCSLFQEKTISREKSAQFDTGSCERIGMDPLVFEPYLRPQVWGNRRLGEMFGKKLATSGTYGESWEISAHPYHVSRVAEGPFKGQLLSDLCASQARQIFGNQTPTDRFPLLIKLLDCHDLLSIQVHPTDEMAACLIPGEMGKTEAWVVLAAKPTARIYAGLLPGITRIELEKNLAKGTADRCLHSFFPKVGDCIFLPAGTVHAVGGGVVLAEVQQTSDATFRLFDWNRPGPDGKPRTLHIEQALASIDWKGGPVRPVTGVPIPGCPGGEYLVQCSYFKMDRYCVTQQLANPYHGRLSIWTVLAGSADLRTSRTYQRPFRNGETVLIPAAAPACSWDPTNGPPTLLAVCLP